MDKFKYIQDVTDKDFKRMFEVMCCIDCGFIPNYNVNQTYGGVSTTIDYKGWLIMKNKDKVCPICYRKRKINNIKKIRV